MTLVAEYQAARRDEGIARLRRVLALRAMVAAGMSQRQIAVALGVSQPAVSWQVPVSESIRSWSRVWLIQIQLISQATGVWVHLHAAVYSAGVR